jgi:plasmid stabilization system protein ParE
MYPKVFDEVRRALMTRFSYAIYFTVDHESIVVLAVTHQARDEKTWKRRVTRRK